MAKLPYKTSAVFWLGDSLEALSGFPKPTKRRLGFAIRQVQNGLMPEIAFPLTGLGGGVYELKTDGAGDTFRVVYIVKLSKGLYVLDAFKKKSKSGKAIPREIANRLKLRAREAREHDKRD